MPPPLLPNEIARILGGRVEVRPEPVRMRGANELTMDEAWTLAMPSKGRDPNARI